MEPYAGSGLPQAGRSVLERLQEPAMLKLYQCQAFSPDLVYHETARATACTQRIQHAITLEASVGHEIVERARILGAVAGRRFRQCFKKFGLGDFHAHDGFHSGRSA